MQTAFLIGGYYSPFPACQAADVLILGAGGIGLNFFGLETSITPDPFFEQRKSLLEVGDRPELMAQSSLEALSRQLDLAE